MSLYHHWIQVQAYKHDGSFHRLWSHGLVVRDDDNYIVTVSQRVRVIESNGHKWHTKEKAVFVFSKREWFNVIATLRDDGIHYYINIASPSIIDKGFIKFIDYDLDIKSFPNGYSKVIDVNEFNAHCLKYGYNDKLKAILKETVNACLKRISQKEDSFQDAIINYYFNDFDNFVKAQITSEKRQIVR